MKQMNKASRDNRANQLNPNNIQYYKSRVDMSKSKHKNTHSKRVKLPTGIFRSPTIIIMTTLAGAVALASALLIKKKD